MITALVISIGGVLVQTFAFLFGQFNWYLPPEIPNAIHSFLGLVNQLAIFIPFISTIIAIYLIVCPAWVIRYIVEIALWIWSLLPFIGSHTQLPGLGDNTLDLRGRNTSRNVLDLREGRRPPSPKNKTMRDIRKP